ncbi:hypothetical protein ACC771_21450, partial [Rhizobium ruizarguesonis]
GHQLGQAMAVDFTGWPVTHFAAVADHRHPVGNLQHLIQSVDEKNHTLLGNNTESLDKANLPKMVKMGL